MPICVLMFGATVYWKLGPVAPYFFELPSTPGVQLVNPSLFSRVETLMDAKRVADREPAAGYVGDIRLFSSEGLAFRIDPNHAPRYRPQDVGRFVSYRSPHPPPLIEPAIALLKALRYFSKQDQIRTNSDDVNFWEWLEVDDVPEVTATTSRPNTMQWSIARSFVDKAITQSDIEAACACDPQFEIPIFDTLFLDAISAHGAHDYRMAILYAAMAVEAAAGTVLNDSYENKVKPSNEVRHRVIELVSTGGGIVRKDPVWELLKRREDAKSLLHEKALYILGKSLLVEDEELFQFATRLRVTRNKIVHHGVAPEAGANEYLPLTCGGSSDALNCASEVFRWLGVGGEYKLHGSGLVQLSDKPESQGEQP